MALDDVIRDLAAVVAAAEETGDRAGFFAALYRQVTVEVARRIDGGSFDDGQRMGLFATSFGARYLDAYRGWHEGRPITEVWRIAFATAAAGSLSILQDCVLGINAHVNLDLPVATAGIGITGLRSDFEQLNSVIARLIVPTERVIDRFSPAIDVLDRLGGRSDEQIVNFSIRAARDDAWHSAVLLAAIPPAEFDVAVQCLDRRAALVARRIAEPGFPFDTALDVVRLTESRDTVAVITALDNLPPS